MQQQQIHAEAHAKIANTHTATQRLGANVHTDTCCIRYRSLAHLMLFAHDRLRSGSRSSAIALIHNATAMRMCFIYKANCKLYEAKVEATNERARRHSDIGIVVDVYSVCSGKVKNV